MGILGRLTKCSVCFCKFSLDADESNFLGIWVNSVCFKKNTVGDTSGIARNVTASPLRKESLKEHLLSLFFTLHLPSGYCSGTWGSRQTNKHFLYKRKHFYFEEGNNTSAKRHSVEDFPFLKIIFPSHNNYSFPPLQATVFVIYWLLRWPWPGKSIIWITIISNAVIWNINQTPLKLMYYSHRFQSKLPPFTKVLKPESFRWSKRPCWKHISARGAGGKTFWEGNWRACNVYLTVNANVDYILSTWK